MSEGLTIDELKQKIKDGLGAYIDKYVMPTKTELPTLSEYVKERFSAEPEDVTYRDYFPLPDDWNSVGIVFPTIELEEDPRDYEEDI